MKRGKVEKRGVGLEGEEVSAMWSNILIAVCSAITGGLLGHWLTLRRERWRIYHDHATPFHVSIGRALRKDEYVLWWDRCGVREVAAHLSDKDRDELLRLLDEYNNAVDIALRHESYTGEITPRIRDQIARAKQALLGIKRLAPLK